MAWFDKQNLRKYAPFVIGASLLVAFGWKFIKPGPPRAVTISAGAVGGAYFEYAKKYADALDKNGVKTTVLSSTGSLQNIERLKLADDAKDAADIAFLQGGLIDDTTKEGLISLGSLYYEPLWVFYRTSKWPQTIDHLPKLKGSAINIGVENSGTRKLALQLLEANDLKAGSYIASSLAPKDAATALKSGSLDAIMMVSAANAPIVKELLTTNGVAAMNMSRADALTRLIPALAKVSLPRGAVSLADDIPSADITVVATTATLAAREDLHPAISYLLIKTATQLHGGAQMLSNAREFPSIAKYQELDVPEDVDKLYKQGAPFLYKHLPFWLANLLYRLWVLIIPLGAAMITLSDALPKLVGFQGNRQIMAIYKEARELEAEVLSGPKTLAAEQFNARLDRLYARTSRVKVPSDFVKSIFELRSHLDLVAQSISRHLGPS
jgi:TRAP transporter TAXI family solute receptor